MIETSKLWHSQSEDVWKLALERYWDYVRPENLELERSMNELKLKQIESFDPSAWYQFLLERYFRWKYTAPNRYATTTMHLKNYIKTGRLQELFEIKNLLLNFDMADIQAGLLAATKINGLGVAGASGLLSLMYPTAFATVDQFVVKALLDIPGVPQEPLNRMNPASLTIPDGIFLVSLMRQKAEECNRIFGGNYWSPRKIDMVLWGVRT